MWIGCTVAARATEGLTVSRQKLELTWIGKDERPKLEPRILLEDPAKSYHAQEAGDATTTSSTTG